MRFRVLGPVSVEPRTPTAAKVRVVLAVLLVRANETVSTESLIDELWDNTPPRTAATTLQVYISQLRRILAEGDPEPGPRRQRLLTIPPGYTLQVADDEVDLTRFENLRQAGKAAYEGRDFAAASGLLQEGLSLWSGTALSGIPHGNTLSAAAVRLDELRMTALEQRITADLRLGRHKELTGELMALINEHPLRETLYSHLMVALFRADRQSDALRTFARARKALIDELGIEPGPGLRHLHERVLRSDPNLVWREPAGSAGPPAAPVVWLPPALPDFVGREDAMTTALHTVPDANGRPPTRILVIGGRAGVGKSAFAVEFARRAAEQFPHGRVQLRLRDAQGAALDPGRALAALAERLDPRPDGTQRLGAEGGQRPGGEGTQRDPAELSEDPADRLRRATRGRRLLIILDDVASQEQVRPLLAALPGAFVVLTTRRPLSGVDGARHLVLDVLQPKEAQQLLREIAGPRAEEDPASVAEIARLCGFLPLGLRVAGAGLAARPHWTAATLAQRLGGEGAGPAELAELAADDLDLRAGLLAGYQEVGAAQRSAFRLLALAPVPDFPLWSAAALLGCVPEQAEKSIDELVQTYLLEVRPAVGGQPRYGYHRLLRALALELLAAQDPPTTTAAVERLGTACLAAARYAAAQLAPGRIRSAGRDGPPGARELEQAARVVGANAVLWFQQECPGLVGVVRRAHAAGLWSLVWQLAESLSGYFEARAAWGDWAETHEFALDAARREGDEAAEAEVLRSLGELAWQQQRCFRAGQYLEEARALSAGLGDRAGAARCLIGVGDIAVSAGESARAAKVYKDALARCAEAGDERGRADALRGLAVVELQCGRAEEALDAFAVFAEEADALGDRRWSRFARRTVTWILEHAPEWSGGQSQWSPRAVQARPGIWVVGGNAD